MTDWRRRLGSATCAGVAAAWLLGLPAWPGEADVPYPEGYSSWVHVKSTLVGPSAPVSRRTAGSITSTRTRKRSRATGRGGSPMAPS